MQKSHLASVLPITLALGLAPSPSQAQMLKDIAPLKNARPMPYIVPGDPSKMNVKIDKSTNIWRELRDPGSNPQDTDPIDIQHHHLQMEPVGIQTFFSFPSR